MNKLRLLFSYLIGHKRQVTAAVIEKDGKVLIARRRKGSTLGGRWEFPGGKIEPGETAETCLKRELKEEFGIESEIGQFIIASRFRHCLVPIELLAYRVKHLFGDFKVNEHEEIRWVSPSEFGSYDFMPADRPIVKLLSSKYCNVAKGEDMEKGRLLILLVTISLCIPVLGSAETIVLKSGKTVEGKITEKTDKYVKMNFQGVEGVEITYFLKDIERIEGEQNIIPKSSSSQSSHESQEGFYVNDQLGFKIKPPKGWFLRQDLGGESGVVLFVKQSAGQPALPMLLIAKKTMLPPEIQGSLEYSKIMLKMSQDQVKNRQSTLQVVEQPHEIEANGRKGARFIFDMIGGNGKMVRNIDCEFVQGNSAIVVQGMDYPDNFQSSLKVFEEAINSLQTEAPKAKIISEKAKKLMGILKEAGKYLMQNKNEEVIALLTKELPEKLDENDKADTDFNAAFGLGNNNLGEAYFRTGKLDKAIEAFKKCKGALPGWSSPYYMLGQSYYRVGKFDESITSFDRAMVIEPNVANQYDYTCLIQSCIMAKRKGDAERFLKIAKEKFPQYLKDATVDGFEEQIKTDSKKK